MAKSGRRLGGGAERSTDLRDGAIGCTRGVAEGAARSPVRRFQGGVRWRASGGVTCGNAMRSTGSGRLGGRWRWRGMVQGPARWGRSGWRSVAGALEFPVMSDVALPGCIPDGNAPRATRCRRPGGFRVAERWGQAVSAVSVSGASGSSSMVPRWASQRAAIQQAMAQAVPAVHPARTSVGQWTPR